MRDPTKKKASTGQLRQGRKRHEQALFSALSIAQMVNVINGGNHRRMNIYKHIAESER